MDGKSSRGLIALLVVFFTVAAILLGVTVVASFQKAEIRELEATVRRLGAESVPMRFVIEERSPDSMSVLVKFYDTAGGEVGQLEAKLPGRELSVDVLIVPYRGAYVAFPYRIFSDSIAPKDGTALPRAYGKGGFPATVPLPTSEKAKAEITSLFNAVASGGPLPVEAFGNAVHEIGKLAAFETGMVYRVVVRPKGGVEIVED
ncbi:MAG: hypothetical protein NT080_13645 [Spirochaetes bacterium]|nr:hypothetical protein [Spirochaetota bacterium]